MLFALASSNPLRRRFSVLVGKWQTAFAIMFNPYRPELHYMRGPGPKWHAKHQASRAGWLSRSI
jgi:hypothetical protein